MQEKIIEKMLSGLNPEQRKAALPIENGKPVHVISTKPGSIITEHLQEEVDTNNGYI